SAPPRGWRAGSSTWPGTAARRHSWCRPPRWWRKTVVEGFISARGWAGCARGCCTAWRRGGPDAAAGRPPARPGRPLGAGGAALAGEPARLPGLRAARPGGRVRVRAGPAAAPRVPGGGLARARGGRDLRGALPDGRRHAHGAGVRPGRAPERHRRLGAAAPAVRHRRLLVAALGGVGAPAAPARGAATAAGVADRA